jgi:uncharacterized protein YybS (DUF2232 family)
VATITIAFFSPELSIVIALAFILPSLILSWLTLKLKSISFGLVLATISFYTAIVCAGVLFYYGFIQSLSIHNVIYDTLTFFSIYANQYIGEELESIKDLSQQLEILAFILPTIMAVFYVIWLFFNYHIAIKIAEKAKILINKEIMPKYDLPPFYTYVSIVLIIFALISNNLLDNQQNLYYILYNVLFILCFGYFYTGFSFFWDRIKSRNSFLISMLYIILIIVLFVELMIIFSVLGFIIEAKRIILKK